MELAVSDLPSFLSLQAALPEIDGTFVLRLVSRALHILSAIIIGGGLFYMRAVLSPGGADACFANRRAVWARWVGIVTLLLLVSGFFNFFAILQDVKAAGEKLPPLYHALFGIKVLLSLVVLFVAAILAGKTAAADRFRAKMRPWLNIGLAAVVAIVAIGATLRMLHGGTPNDDRPAAIPNAEASDG